MTKWRKSQNGCTAHAKHIENKSRITQLPASQNQSIMGNRYLFHYFSVDYFSADQRKTFVKLENVMTYKYVSSFGFCSLLWSVVIAVTVLK